MTCPECNAPSAGPCSEFCAGKAAAKKRREAALAKEAALDAKRPTRKTTMADIEAAYQRALAAQKQAGT